MRQWLIKLLGGWIEEEYSILWEQTLDMSKTKEEEIVFYRQELKQKDIEIQRLTNLMLVHSGFLIGEKISQAEIKQHEPIIRRQSWPARQREMEREDAKRAADLTAERWAKKAEDLVQQELEEKLNASKVS